MLTQKGSTAMGRLLEQVAASVSVRERVEADPVRFPRHALSEGRSTPEIEAIALFSAMLAYGAVPQFSKVICEVLASCDGNFLDLAQGRRTLAHWPGYRLNPPGDIEAFVRAIGRVIERDGSLEACFAKGCKETPAHPLRAGLRSLRGALLESMREGKSGAATPSGLQGRNNRCHHGEVSSRRRTTGLPHGRAVSLARETVGLSPQHTHLVPDPGGIGCCKRWLLFLRWMVRPDDGVDLGLWSVLRPAELVIPLDRHISRLARHLGLTDRRTDSWATACEITDVLRRIDPDDPVRFDFALCHLGISKACTHRFDPTTCPTCSLRDLCRLA
jgi:uncharacterized protein (TIGR02757 family)